MTKFDELKYARAMSQHYRKTVRELAGYGERIGERQWSMLIQGAAKDALAWDLVAEAIAAAEQGESE